MDMSAFNLPASVLDRVAFFPYEDILAAMFQRAFPELRFETYVSEVLTYPMITGARFTPQGGWSGDPRFIDSGPVRINVFCAGPDADVEAFLISEAIRVMMLEASLERWNFPGLGSIVNITMSTEPADVNDWATATGIVQFADLPEGVIRFETVYQMTIRRP